MKKLFLVTSMIIIFGVTVIFNNFLVVVARDEATYYDASEKLQQANIIIARPVENPFKDTLDMAQVTRAEISLIILNALRKDVPPIAENSYFQDCEIKDWYTPYINKLFDLKIVSGYGNGNFKPNNIVTNFEAVTMIVRCLGYDNIKIENDAYPYKYLEIAKKLNLLENTTIGKLYDEPLTNGNMFMLLLNAMRSNINNDKQKLWDLGIETSLYKKITGEITSVNDSEYIVSNENESLTLIWNYEENISDYLNEEVSVWFVQSENENYVIDMIRRDYGV